jgi:hypothetical protein
MSDVTGTKISADWASLEFAGIDRGTPISLRMRDATLSNAIDAILRDAGGPNAHLGYVVHDGVIKISTRSSVDPARPRAPR